MDDYEMDRRDIPCDDEMGVTADEMDAFYRDMGQFPLELPTPDEVTEMARQMGSDTVPF